MEPEQQTRLERALSSYAMEHTELALVVLDGDGAFAAANRAARELLGGVDLAAVFSSGADLDAHTDVALVLFRAALRGSGHAVAQVVLGGPAGGGGTARLFALSGGRVEGGYVVRVDDPSAERSAAEELVRLRRMQQASRLVLSVAHDFNNLLTPILHLSARLAAAPQWDGETALAVAREIASAAESAVALARQLQSLSRRA